MLLEDLVLSRSSVDLKTLSRVNTLTYDVQRRLFGLTLLDPPIDGVFGPVSNLALRQFAALVGLSVESKLEWQLAEALLNHDADSLAPVSPKENFAGRIFRYMQRKNYFVARFPNYFTIVYVEGTTKTGMPNDNRANAFNDRRIVLAIENGTPVEMGNWTSTTEPGKDYTETPLDPRGAARIAFGQYKAWRVGVHHAGQPSGHEALVQVGTIRIHRDLNKDYQRIGDAVFEGSQFGINQHWGYDRPEDNVGAASAGCLVGRSKDEHREFMRIVKRDTRVKASQGYTFITAVVDETDLAQLDR